MKSTKEKYNAYMKRHKKDIKKDLNRLQELSNIFVWNTDQEYEYDVIFKGLLFEYKFFNIRFNTHIELKTYINMFLV